MGIQRKQLAYLKPYTGSLVAAVVLTGGLTIIGMAPPLLMRRLLNDVAKQGQWGIFPMVMGLLFAVPVLRAVVNLCAALALNKVGLGVIADLRNRMFAHLLKLSMRFHNGMPAAAVNQRLMGDVANVSTIVTGGAITLLTDLIAVSFALVVMLKLSWQLSILTLLLLPLYFLNYRFFSKRIQQANVTLRSHMDHISTSLQERLSAHELIQSYAQEKTEAAHFSSQAKQIMDAATRGGAYSISFNQIAAFINKIGNTSLYCAGCYLFITGKMGYGDVVAFCAYSTQILGPVVRFSSVANQIKQVGVSLSRIGEIMDRKPAIEETLPAVPVQELGGDVRVDGVTFAYDDGTVALQDLHLDIPAGSHVAIVGPTGAGRSTLASLLRRFYDPQQGRVEVGGTDVREYRLEGYRSAVGLVLPEVTIFDDTIRSNLAYGKPDATQERMIETATAVGLHSFVTGLADGYDTRLGTGGLKLSTGMQQRIGIARALLSEPFVLIIDEATAALDPDSAQEVNEAVRKAMAGRTCIIIVSRTLMARDADLVVGMDDGRVVESGGYEELLATPDGLCRTLFAMQYGPERLPPATGESQ